MMEVELSDLASYSSSGAHVADAGASVLHDILLRAPNEYLPVVSLSSVLPEGIVCLGVGCGRGVVHVVAVSTCAPTLFLLHPADTTV
jgi:hypothetical protein